jgi:hypothetical protein
MTNPELLFDPEPEPPPELPHWLTVKEWGSDRIHPDNDDDLFEIEHHPDCPTELVSPEDSCMEDFTYETHSCIFQQMVNDMGIDSYFQHRDDPIKNDPYSERVAPGRWPIEPWFETYYGHEGNEYDAGLRVVKETNEP